MGGKMKVTVESKKGLKTNLIVFLDKKPIQEKIGFRLNELSKEVNLKGFRPGKVPVEVLKRQFGKAVYGEVLQKILQETSSKAIEEKKIKVAGQPKLDLKTYFWKLSKQTEEELGKNRKGEKEELIEELG